MSNLDDFRKDLDENKKSDRADYFKLKNGDNKIVLLTNPVGYSELFGVGIAYKGCGYADYASRRYKCYVKDLSDGLIKIANFSYTVSKKIVALADGARTKFDGFPMPYVINLQTKNAGSKTVETEVLADEDYTLSDEDNEILEAYDSILDIVTRLKNYMKNKVDTDPAMKEKIRVKIESIENERAASAAKRKAEAGGKEIPTVQIGGEVDAIEYPEEEIDPEDIPF